MSANSSQKKPIVKGQSREIVNNVREFFEKTNYDSSKTAVELTNEATQVSKATIYRIKKEKSLLSPPKTSLFSTPKKGGSKKTVTNIDSLTQVAIKQMIWILYILIQR